MIEKVNPSHPDKQCDRIGGALVDLAYAKSINPKIAVEVLLGHGHCHIIAETTVHLTKKEVTAIVNRIVGPVEVDYLEVPQDSILNKNQAGKFRCGDNGIFVGLPLTEEEKEISKIARDIYARYPYDGKYILDGDKLVICQSHAREEDLRKLYPNAIINPLGYWTGSSIVDAASGNRKLGSDQGHSVSGGGVNLKDLSKADVSVNIYAFLKAQQTGKPVYLSCAIGDEYIDGKPYGEIVAIAKEYIKSVGGFEKFSEWGMF